MDKADLDARACAGSVKRIAAALRKRDEKIARLEAQAQVETHRYLSLEAKADQMRADLGQAREERDAALEAMRGVVSVADRKTKEFDAARACLARLPQAALRAQAQRDVVAAAKTLSDLIRWDDKHKRYVIEGHDDVVGVLLSDLRMKQHALARLAALESGGGE